MKKFVVVALGLSSLLSSAIHQPVYAAPAKVGKSAGPLLMPVSASSLKSEIAKRKGKLVVVNFWATWCPPCMAEMPALVKLKKQYAKRGLSLLLVSADEPNDVARKVRPFLRLRGITWPTHIIGGDPLEFIEKFDPKLKGNFTLPRFYVYNRKGKLIQSFTNTQVAGSERENYRLLEKRFKPLL